MSDLKEIILTANLTKTQKMIANYILENSSDACFMTSTEIAMKLGVSESSVIRFSRSLGFSGFMDFQKALRKDYQDKSIEHLKFCHRTGSARGKTCATRLQFRLYSSPFSECGKESDGSA